MAANKHLSQENIICQERIRQAHWAFNLAASFVAICSGITLVGFILFLTGQTSQGTYITAGGLTSTAVGSCCMRFACDANDRLDKLAAREIEHQSSNPNNEAEDKENNNIEDIDGNDLTDALEKLEQTILLEVLRNR